MDEIRPGYYAVIPADVRYDDNIPPNAKLLYGEISALIGPEGYCFATNQYFANLYQCTVKSISRLISKLEDEGYIRLEMERGKNGQVERRKLYLSVSAPEIYPVDNIVYTSGQSCPEGMDKNVQYTNTSITSIEKENKKEKVQAQQSKRTPLTDEALRTLFVQWITGVEQGWTKEEKNGVYFALDGFYSPRDNRKKEPARTEAAFTALSNRLLRYSGGNPSVMVDMLERATTAGWKSVFSLEGDRGSGNAASGERREEEWL